MCHRLYCLRFGVVNAFHFPSSFWEVDGVEISAMSTAAFLEYPSIRRLREIMSMVTSVSMGMQSRFGTFRGSLLPITKYFLQSSVPRPQSEPTSKNEEAKVWWGAQDPNPAIAENPSVLHGLDPSVMSSRPVRPSPYSQGLRKRAAPYR